jgi:hypothetical protein
MNEKLMETSQIYTEIRNNSFELIENLNTIKDQIYIFDKDISLFQVQIDTCIESYNSLTGLLDEEDEFFEMLKKKNEMNSVINNIHTIIVSIINNETNLDKINGIHRRDVIEWTTLTSDCLNNLIHELKNNDSYSEEVLKIENIFISHSLILEDDASSELFDFEYIYKTKDFTNYLFDAIELLNSLKNQELDMSILMDVFEILSKVPSTTTIKQLFNH